MLRQLRQRVPFAVVGANTVIEVDGKKVRGRRYPWGVAEGEEFEIIVSYFVVINVTFICSRESRPLRLYRIAEHGDSDAFARLEGCDQPRTLRELQVP